MAQVGGVLPDDRPRIGRLGEKIAADFLARRGAVVVARNVESPVGEIDLIVRLGGELAAVEVRTARRNDYAPDLMAYKKEQQVRRVAASLETPIFRVDLVTVLLQPDGVKVRWIPRL